MDHSMCVGRGRLRARRALLATSAILAAACGSPTFAQLAAPAPVRQSVDGYGVDLFLGTLNVTGPKLSLGQDDPQGLSYYQTNRGGVWSDNIIASLNLSGNVMTVSLGSVSDTFTVGSGYTNTQGNGATLTYNSAAAVYTYTASDGTQIHFDKNRASPAPYYASEGRATDIIRPSGAKLTFAYDSVTYCSRSKPGGSGDICTGHSTSYRVSTVHNSYGYQLAFSYQSDAVDSDFVDPSQVVTWSTVTGVTGSNLAAATTAAKPTETFGYTTSGGITYYVITDPLGRVTKYRAGVPSVLGITLPGSTGEDVTVAYDGSGKVASITTPAGTTAYAYSDDPSGIRTTTVTDALSNKTTYTFDTASQRMKTMVDPIGNATSDPGHHTTRWDYDAQGRVTQITQPEGNYTKLTYLSADRDAVTEVRQVAKSGSGVADLVTSSVFDPTCGNPVTCNLPNTTTDARGAVTHYSYDPTHGGVTNVTQAAPSAGAPQPQTTYSYTPLQAYFRNGGTAIVASGETVYKLTGTSTCQTQASCVGSADEVRSTINYGPQTAGTGNNLLPVTVSQGAGDGSLTATTTYGYDAIGNTVSVDGPLDGTGDTTNYAYDADRELTQVTSPDPDGTGALKRRAVVYHYMANGLIDTTSFGALSGGNAFVNLQYTLTAYDAARRKTSDTLMSGAGASFGVTQYSYDGAGRLECTAQRMNAATWGSLPASACTLGTAGSFGNDRITRSVFDADSRVIKTQVGYGTPEQSDSATATYNPNGTVATMADANGNLTTYSYDGLDRLFKTQYPLPGGGGSSGTDYEQLAYDGTGFLTGRRLRDGTTIGYSYDALGRLTYQDNPNANVADTDASYSYDNLGRILRGQDQNGWFTAFEYDALSRVTRQYSNLSSNTFQYDLAGHRTRQTWADGFYVTSEYLVTGETSVIRENGSLALATYTYDNYGRRTALTRGNTVATGYAYDAVSRLATLKHNPAGTAYDLTLGFTYNPAGQIATTSRSNNAYVWTGAQNLSRGYAVNGLNQYTTSGNVTPGYDARGNLTSAAGQTYRYNAKNQLFGTADPSQLFYRDPSGNLGQILSGTSGTNLDYVGQALATEFNGGNGAVLRRYVYGPGSDEPLVWYEGPGTSDRRYLLADERGSVIATSNDAGTVTNVNTYDEFGIPGPNNVGRFQFTGQKWLAELGMYDYKARMYSPTMGRFLQTDPIGYADGLNWYNYVGSDPINGVDPSGLDAECGASGHFGTVTGSRIPRCLSNGYGSSDGSGNGFGGVSSGGHGSGAGLVGNAGANSSATSPTGMPSATPQNAAQPGDIIVNGLPQSWDLNGDGLLSRGEANIHFRNGAGTPLTVDASKLKFRILADRGKGLYLGQSIGYSQFETYGKVDLVKIGSSWFVLPNTYDFDMKGGIGNLARDAATLLGWASATNYTFRGGTAYDINFQGSPQVFCQGSSRRC